MRRVHGTRVDGQRVLSCLSLATMHDGKTITTIEGLADGDKSDRAMSTRSSDQLKKQRQKEFKERKEHQASLKAAAKKAKRDLSKNDEIDRTPKIDD